MMFLRRATALLLTNNLTVQPLRRHFSNPISPVNQQDLLRVCTILYQQQNSPESRLHSKLASSNFQLTHEFFLQVCNNFPYSWRPVYRFFLFTQLQKNPTFTHSSVSFNKMLDVVSKSRNIDLFWNLLNEAAIRRLANDKTFVIALKTLGGARELKKCVEFFHLMNCNGCGYSVERLNKVVDEMCRVKLVEEAKFVVFKMKDWIKPDGVSYKHLISGFCEKGDLIEASKIWNLMVDEGFVPDVDAVEKFMETFFKVNQFGEALKLFETMRLKRMDELGVSTYRLVIKWLCKKGMMNRAHEVFDELCERGILVDSLTLGYVVYGLLAKHRVREAYQVVEKIDVVDISVYHGLIKGLLKLRRASEATQVFREMIKRGCEPNMHTYIMLLQGHLGRRGRKGSDPLVNFDTIFVGGLVKVGHSKEAMKYVERVMDRGMEVPRFDYNKFLHYFSNEEGAVMFEDVAKKLKEVGLVDLADILERYGQKMATRDRRRNRFPIIEDTNV
ncbi:putative pentatricopeptide repeat-containing protein At1g26500 isoform X2 [Vicia villosa]|uniref:putative pentatricopeptide repeat-containing protein At1g26500 isoform X2 n=1 Tax=Vicia villosa TaxID=3911 RepID=UPI00273B2BD3|nr:putative pentatricopeptide repeat-containing protein At1g26500 isoform X2 [Vicia villosa]XP_058769438.1 putative pentatricopeptide repeat-containing protein At1g26500 isoform X2 [Vicia villosa]